MAAIGRLTIEAISGSIKRQLIEHEFKLDEAYRKAEGSFDITLKAKVTPSKGGNEIQTSISFVAEKISDTVKFHVDEEQRSLFEDQQ